MRGLPCMSEDRAIEELCSHHKDSPDVVFATYITTSNQYLPKFLRVLGEQ